MQAICKGDVYYYNFNRDGYSRLERKTRPCVVISSNEGLLHSEICIIAPITSRPKFQCNRYQSWFKNKDGKDNIILLEQSICVLQKDLFNYQGHLSEVELQSMDIALHYCLGLKPNVEDIDINRASMKFETSCENIIKEQLTKFSDLKSEIENINRDVVREVSEIKLLIDNISNMFNTNNSNTRTMIDKLIAIFLELKNGSSPNNKIEENPVITSKESIDVKPKNNKIDKKETIESDNEKPKEKIKEEKQIVDINTDKNSKIDEKYDNFDFTQRIRWTKELAEFYIAKYDELKIAGMMKKYNLTENAVKNKRTGAIAFLSKNGWESPKKSNSSNDTSNTSTTSRNSREKYTEQYCLEFMKNYRELSYEKLEVIYGVSKRQLQAKKWSVTHWLKENKIPYDDIDKRNGNLMHIDYKGENE